MIAIACVDNNNGIGKDGKLLISIPEDMKFFREVTDDSIVVMGRKTLFSFKDKAPLKNRINVVFTNNKKLEKEYKDYDNIFFIKTLTELNEIFKKHPEKKVFLIGGATLYNDLIDFCDKCYITKVNKTFKADSFFPNLEAHGFILDCESEVFTHNKIEYKFITYKKVKG